MLTVTNVKTYGWETAIRGMRNPMSVPGGDNNSWGKSDSDWVVYDTNPNSTEFTTLKAGYSLGPNDLDLATRLIKAGPEHAKFLRMIHVQMDINAPLYYWKEMDQYKVGTTTNSCSTMHKIHVKEFELSDFSCEHLLPYPSQEVINAVIASLNSARLCYLECQDQITKKDWWWQLIQLLPSSYNQLRTWDASLATVLTILKQRKGHKLDEWHEFRRIMFEELPYLKEFYTAMTNDTDFN